MRLKNKNVLFFTKLIVFGALFMMILLLYNNSEPLERCIGSIK